MRRSKAGGSRLNDDVNLPKVHHLSISIQTRKPPLRRHVDSCSLRPSIWRLAIGPSLHKALVGGFKLIRKSVGHRPQLHLAFGVEPARPHQSRRPPQPISAIFISSSPVALARADMLRAVAALKAAIVELLMNPRRENIEDEDFSFRSFIVGQTPAG